MGREIRPWLGQAVVVPTLGFFSGLTTGTLTESVDERVRGVAGIAASLAGLFLFAATYLTRYRIGFGQPNGVVWPDGRPGDVLVIHPHDGDAVRRDDDGTCGAILHAHRTAADLHESP